MSAKTAGHTELKTRRPPTANTSSSTPFSTGWGWNHENPVKGEPPRRVAAMLTDWPAKLTTPPLAHGTFLL
jgi:hypothetical protein